MPRSKTGKSLTRTRSATHGPFGEVARITVGITDIFQSTKNWGRLSRVAKMALQEIVHKQARILSGDYKIQDHWNDIGGYAQLGADDVAGADELAGLKKRVARVKAAKVRKPRPAKKVAARPAKVAVKKRTPKPKLVRPVVRRPRRPAVAAVSPVREAA